MQHIAFLLILLGGSFSSVYAAVTVDNSRVYPRMPQGDRVYAGELSLPSGEKWRISDSREATANGTPYLLGIQSTPSAKPVGRRLGMLQAKQTAQRGQSLLQTFYQALRDHAQGNGKGPQGLEDLEPKASQRLMAFNANAWKQEEPLGPYAFLLPGVEFVFLADSKHVDRARRQLLMVELQPYIDDGKHWRLYTDGSTVREAIDPALVERHRLQIKPVMGETMFDTPAEAKTNKYRILTLQPTAPAAPLAITLENATGSKSLEVSWDTTQAVTDAAVLEEMKQARLAAWRRYAAINPDNLALLAWIESLDETGKTAHTPRRPGNRDNTSSFFNLLGGRAAVRETLQLQALQLDHGSDDPATVDIDTLDVVEIASHPFASMFKETPEAHSLPLAEIVPPDRFFLYAKPEALAAFLERGSEFIHDIDGLFTSEAIDYNLKKRYLKRLGLSEIWLSTFLQSGIITEAALVVPDLFFIDGTEITVAARLANPDLLPPLLLRGIGLPSLAEGSISKLDLSDDREVFWALAGDLLICGTSRQEVAALLDLKAKDGEGSLGKSPEFRYMLQKLPVEESTRLYAYLSDPFIRELIGPKTKIGQLRRMQARRDLEKLTGSALFAKLDGMRQPSSLPQLVAQGYAPSEMMQGDYSLADDLSAHSGKYGHLGGLTPVSRLDIRRVTPQEAAAYRRYVENYNRFWSRYFDPIAMRLNDRPDGSLEATTFILPLIENSIYDALRNTLAPADQERPLRLPVVDPQPLSMLSFNLNEEALLQVVKTIDKMLRRRVYIHPALYDDLGPSMHLAVHDADPIISFGSADLLGAFSNTRLLRTGRLDPFLIPAALTILTRPCTLYIETQSPARTRAYLQQATFFRRFRNTGVNAEIHQVGEDDNWIVTFNVMGLIRLRFGLGIDDRYLTIKNIPWGPPGEVTTTLDAQLNGASLKLAPNAAFKQLPALFNTANEQERKSAMEGLSYLYPILASGYADIREAPQAHEKLFGFAPTHPANGKWLWDGSRVTSSRYGSLQKQRQPAYREGQSDFGLFRDIESIDLNMQLEEAGLRASVVWRLKAPQIR